MHAAVRGERLLGIAAHPAPCQSAATRDHHDQESLESVGASTYSEQESLSLFNPTFIGLLILSLFMNIPISLVGPFFSNEAMDHGVPLVWVGAILSSFPFSVFLSAPFWGKMVTFLGPKFLILGGGLTTSICVTVFSLIDDLEGNMFIAFGIAIRILQGIGCAASETGATAMLAVRFPESIGTVSAMMDVAESIGFMIGPIIGGVLYQHGGFRSPFIVTGAITMLSMVPLVWLIPKRSRAFVRYSDISVTTVLTAPGVILVVVSASLGMSVFSFLELALQPHFMNRNLSASQLGFLFLLVSTVYALCSPIVGWFTRPENVRQFIVIGLMMIAFALCMLGPAPIWIFPEGFPYQILALILISAGCSLVLVPVVPSMTFAVAQLGPHATDVVAGVITSAFSAGEAVGPIIGGFFLQRFGFPVGSAIYAFIILVAGIAMLMYTVANPIAVIWSDEEYDNEQVDTISRPLLDNEHRDNVSSCINI